MALEVTACRRRPSARLARAGPRSGAALQPLRAQ